MTNVEERAARGNRWDGLVPSLAWLREYRRDWLRPDIVAGLATWAVVVPQAIAYAQIAGLPPQAGLFTTFAGCLAYGLLGTSRQLVVSPMSGPAAVSAAIVAPIALGDTARYADLSATLAMMAGIAFIVLGWWKAGFISQFIAPAVQAGFMFGLGLTIILGQTAKMLGVSVSDGAFIEQLRDLIENLDQTHGWTALLGLSGLAAMLALQRLMPGVPAALLVVGVSIIVVSLFDLTGRGVAVVGDVPREAPLPSLPATIGWSDLALLFPGALAIALIGYAESISVSEEFAERHRYDIRPNQELVALGASNVLSGLFRGFIVGGGASQSAANDRAGARTQVAVLVLALLAALTAALLLPLFENLPIAVLGAIVTSAVIGFLNVPALRRIRRLRQGSFVLAIVALVGVLVLGILQGLLLTVALSVILLLGHQSRPRSAELGVLPDTSAWVDVASWPDARTEPGVLVFRFDAPLLFINATWMRNSLKERLERLDPPPRVVVIDLQLSSELDIQGLNKLGQIANDLDEGGIELRLANVHTRVHEMLRRDGVAATMGEHRIFRSVGEAVRGGEAP